VSSHEELAEVLKDWEAVIGLEVHTELTTLDTKMFCNCRLSRRRAQHQRMPGVSGHARCAPVPNRKAIRAS